MEALKHILELLGFALVGALAALLAGALLVLIRVITSRARRRQLIRIRAMCIEESLPISAGVRTLLTTDPDNNLDEQPGEST